jgi:hypothetical protein
MIDSGDVECLRRFWPHLPTWHWIYWLSNTKPHGWQEDVFYARRDWLSALEFFHHGNRMAFQDVYDLMRAAFGLLRTAELAPDCRRIPREANEVMHIPHARPRSCFCRETYEWFQSQRAQWSHTSYAKEDLWKPWLAAKGRPVAQTRSLLAFRRGPGGTVTRWQAALEKWLAHGGVQVLQKYNESIVAAAKGGTDAA